MYRTYGEFETAGGRLTLSFRETKRWSAPAALRQAVRGGESQFDTTALLLGDQDNGPLLLFLAVKRGVDLPDAPAHFHASDNFRLSVRGVLSMGSEQYGPGQFRLQQGWKPYASDNYANGPDGGWTVLLFGDRRGVKVRHVSRDAAPDETANRMLADWLGIAGDLLPNNEANTSGPSALATNLGRISGSHLNSSFANAHTWPEVGSSTRAAGALLGDPTSGPVLILAETSAGASASPHYVFDTEVFHLVVNGSCIIGNEERCTGDMYIQQAGESSTEVIAGPDGLQEMIVLGDRRGVRGRANDSGGWPGMVVKMVDDLSRDIQPNLVS